MLTIMSVPSAFKLPISRQVSAMKFKTRIVSHTAPINDDAESTTKRNEENHHHLQKVCQNCSISSAAAAG